MATSTPLMSMPEPSKAQSQRVNILIADETSMGCQLLKNALTRSRLNFEVVACATSRSEVMRCMGARNIEVALLSETLQEGPFAGFCERLSRPPARSLSSRLYPMIWSSMPFVPEPKAFFARKNRSKRSISAFELCTRGRSGRIVNR
jgi:hypothetical protein